MTTDRLTNISPQSPTMDLLILSPANRLCQLLSKRTTRGFFAVFIPDLFGCLSHLNKAELRWIAALRLNWNVRQTGLLLQPCVGSVRLLCPCPEGGNTTVKLSPNCAAVELNNNHRTLGTHNSHAAPFVAFCHFTNIRQRYISQRHIARYFFCRVKCQPPALIHSIFLCPSHHHLPPSFPGSCGFLGPF